MQAPPRRRSARPDLLNHPATKGGRGGDITVVIPAWGARYLGYLPEAVASVERAVAGARVVLVARAPQPDLLGIDSFIPLPGSISVGAARNLGLAAVATPLVAFLDADDLLHPDSLERLRAVLAADPSAVAATGQVIEVDTGAVVAPRGWSYRLAEHQRLFSFFNTVWSLLPTQGATLMRTDAVRAAGGYSDSDGGEDWAMGVSLSQLGPVRLVQIPALDYRPSSEGPAPTVGNRELRRRAGAAGPAGVRDKG